MGIFRRGFGVDRHLRLVRAVGRAQGHQASSATGPSRARLRRALVLLLFAWGLVSIGFVWCVAGRECDYEWPCFSATFFNVVTQ